MSHVNVFVLGTGRCGSVTFATACRHFTNFSVGHESRARLVGPDRLAFPDQHIEVDNRLSWHLGSIGCRFEDDRTFYVHLVRDRAAVIDSFERRWDSPFRASIIRAFAHGIVMRSSDWDDHDRRAVCEAYVTTVEENIREFLAGRDWIEIAIESATDDFPSFADRIGALGDIDAARAEFAVRHNAS